MLVLKEIEFSLFSYDQMLDLFRIRWLLTSKFWLHSLEAKGDYQNVPRDRSIRSMVRAAVLSTETSLYSQLDDFYITILSFMHFSEQLADFSYPRGHRSTSVITNVGKLGIWPDWWGECLIFMDQIDGELGNTIFIVMRSTIVPCPPSLLPQIDWQFT